MIGLHRRNRPRHASPEARSTPARPLRIGIMARSLDDIDGQGIYARKLFDALFELDRYNQYILFYQHPGQAGRYARLPNVREVVVTGAPGKLLWDQLAVPLAAWRAKLDVLFHHKFSIPLVCPCPTVVQQRGTEYWRFPDFYPGLSGWLDRTYNKLMIPLYCRRARRVLTNSDSLAAELTEYTGLRRSDLHTVYAAADESFAPVTDAAELERVREAYRLPARDFFLAVVKGHQIINYQGRKLGRRKNVEGVLRAYGRVQREVADCPPLVIIGLGIAERLSEEDLRAYADPASIFLPGFIDFVDMPALYSMARALLFPSFYESFGIPLVEAMACGCPVITSDTSACPEVVGDAGLTVDPGDDAGLADAMRRILVEDGLADRLRQRGFARARQFSWQASARVLLAELTLAAAR